MKRLTAVLLTLSLIGGLCTPVFACREEQSDRYVLQILFGDEAVYYDDHAEAEMLMNALYLCSAQSDGSGQSNLDSLKKAKLWGLPKLDRINVDGAELFECSHNSWDYTSTYNEKAQAVRKKLLRKTVIKVFDFGWFDEIFYRNSGQIDSFSALLYYTHILADYLAGDPIDTEISAKGYDIPAFSGNPEYILNSNIPSFGGKEKQETDSYKEYSDFDKYGRCGPAITNIGPDTLENVAARGSISNIYPTGWAKGNKYYEDVIAGELYNRCHLVAHSLGGADTQWNLITGTRYLNEAMERYERKVADYIKETDNHVLYRVTPVYVGADAVASGVQLEAYSMENRGKGLSFNVYLYNVQPGIDIDYENGSSELADLTVDAIDILPFATENPSDGNPDLMFEIQKHLEILFADQKESSAFKSMMNDLDTIAKEARSVEAAKAWKVYSEMKKHQYAYLEALTKYVPELLEKEDFFISAFG